jgi:PAS domain S-box-containing protein
VTPLARADRRVRDLYEISTILTRFDGVERTLAEVVAVTARAVPIRGAVIILDGRDGSEAHVWRTEDGGGAPTSRAAVARAREGFAWFGGARPAPHRERPSSHPLPPSSDLDVSASASASASASEKHRFLLVPLVVKRGRVFGVLQVEGPNGLDEADVWFVNAVANQLAVAIERQSASDVAEARLRAQLDFTRGLTGSLGEGILATDTDARITFLNPAAEQLLGWTETSVLGILAVDVLRVQRPDGTMLNHAECPLVQSLETRRRVVSDDHAFLGRDGLAVPVSYTSAPILSAGRLCGAVVVFRDVLAVKRSERMQRLLAGATAMLGASLSHRETLAAIVSCTVPAFADVCFIDEANERRSVRARAHLGDAADVELLRASGATSVVVVPLSARGHALGVLIFGMAASGRHFTEDDLALAEELGHRAAMAIDNARLYRATQDAVRDRQDILAMVSHDLRTPLNTVAMAAASLLEGRSELCPADRHIVELVGRSAKRMERMTNDLLDVASIEAGHLAIDARPVAVTTILHETLEVMNASAAARSVELVVGAADPLLLVRCDRDRVLQVLSNLLSNAIKFTPAGGTIELSVEGSEAFVRFAVTDSGPGIADSLRPHLFERYRQANDTAAKGRGLGLFIAKGIVVAHGGSVDVDTAPGRGATVSFRLPRVVAALASTARDRDDEPNSNLTMSR